MHVYEVFVRFRPGEAARHVGSVRSPDPEAALEAALNIYLRRDAFKELWAVDRECIHELVVSDEASEKERMQKTEYRRPSYFVRRLTAAGYRPAKLSGEGEE